MVDGEPVAWSFHHLHVVNEPEGFPPAAVDLPTLAHGARSLGAPFRSRLVVADFVRHVDGRWFFLEAGPGSCAGTAHESVFKHVAPSTTGHGRVVGR